RGKREEMTVFSEEPVLVARRWEQDGASIIHVVDLDGAFSGEPKNAHLVKRIAEETSLQVQVGGGIRSYEVAEDYLESGVSRVILGTSIVRSPDLVKRITDRFGERVVAGIDAVDGIVAIRGWVEVTGLSAVDLARDLQKSGIRTFVYTDITRDGTLEGPNFEALEEFARSVEGSVIASGGVSSLEDVKRIKEISREKAEGRITGVIIGKALYSSRIDFRKAIELEEEE
ncbi:MAG: 1-(5-phosphoribosyl)-5-[(5-phosphoribosylamino)methylideneamino]imidazole-4-carboxamide isomerase, partial [Deltaproteobacteria bacterium]